MTKSKQINWTPIIITSLILLFLLIIISSIDFRVKEYNYQSSENYQDENLQTNYEKAESIIINGKNGIRTINYPNKEVKLLITGMENIITITKDTQISQITITGMNNQINLCETHSPKITDSGTGNKIDYLDC